MDFSSSDTFSQIVMAVAITIVVFIVYMVAEQLNRLSNGYAKARVAVYPLTSSGSDMKVTLQDESNPVRDRTDPATGEVDYTRRTRFLSPSENQLTGIEFSYTTFIYIKPENDDGTLGWKSVFIKGYESGDMPLLAPGVFVSSNNYENGSPILRIVMNTYDNWFNTIDVHQIPFRKWFHLAIVLHKNTLEVYINGNLSNKLNFKGTLPYQNYQPLVIYPQCKLLSPDFDNSSGNTSKRGIPPGDNMVVSGPFTGFVSNLYYFSYALTYSEIMEMLNMGPSTKVDTSGLDAPPYLIDSWWTQQRS